MLVIVGILLLILPWLSRKTDDLVWKNNALLQNAPYTVRFTDREILQFTPRGELCVCYADVEHIYDSRQGLLLKLKGQSLILADKSQLTPEQFSAILQLLYNAGVKYKYVNR